jgi:hypothetical protein
MQVYVNAPGRRALLDQRTLAALPSLRAAGATTLDWRAPLQRPLWAEYWPGRSQRWDALAVARDDTATVLGRKWLGVAETPELTKLHTNKKLATSEEQWKKVLPVAARDFGLDGKKVPHAGRAYLRGGTYEELEAATGERRQDV